MQVQEESDVMTLLDFLHQSSDSHILRDLRLAGCISCPLPAPVDVHPFQGTATVAKDDAVRVDHWDDHEDIVLQQIMAGGKRTDCPRVMMHRLLDDPADDPVQDIAGCSLGRVLSGNDEDHLFARRVWRSLFTC